MEKNFMLTDDLLWDYADGFLEGEEKKRVEAFLQQNPEQQARFDAIMAEKRAFAALPLEKTDADFAQKVMTAWLAEKAMAPSKASAPANGRDWILWSIGALFGLMLLLPFFLSPAAAPADYTLQIPEQYIPQVQMPTFDWAGLMSSAFLRNALLFVLGIMSLKLLDKYLQVRNLQPVG